jgi:uncharacterized protein YkwD
MTCLPSHGRHAAPPPTAVFPASASPPASASDSAFVYASVLVKAVVALVATGTALSATAGPAAAADASQAEQIIVDQTNRFRRAEGRPPVLTNRQLDAAARGFAQFMARSGQYGHAADGRQPVQRTRAAGYDECQVAENIAFQYSSAGFGTQALAEGFFDGWRNSAGHRRNMLDPDATETGVAIARSEVGRYYAVQLFGRPAAQRVRFDIGNRGPQPVRYELDGKDFELPPRATRTHLQCGEPALRLQLPGAAEPAVLRPEGGDRLRVERVNARWRVVKG